jgi:hypothetical protein
VTFNPRRRKQVPLDRAALPTVTQEAVLTYACPRCTAKPDVECRSGDGKVLRAGHADRRLVAQRAAFRAGRRPASQPVVDAEALSPEAQARREEYAAEQEARRTRITPPPASDRAVQASDGPRIVNAADAVSRIGRHRLRVDDGR